MKRAAGVQRTPAAALPQRKPEKEVRIMVQSILHEPAVLYLRMSSGKQEASIPSQRAALLEYAAKHGYRIVGEYVDEAISGDATDKRAGFLRMREDAAAGKYRVILCWDQDRFGRFDPIEGGHWIFPFRQSQVRLETIAQGRIDWEDLVGQLVYSINQVGKAQYLRDLSRNTVRGQLSAAQAGRAGTGGAAPYGYRSQGAEVWIVPEEAEVVRWIFAEYLLPDRSIRAIAAELNQRRVPTPRGSKAWKQNTVRGILGRRKYTGTFVYGAESSGRYFAARGGEMVPRRKSDPIAPSQPIVIPGRFEALIDQDTFEAVQHKLALRQTNRRTKRCRCFALSGLLRCGNCGGTYAGSVRGGVPRYMCRTYQQGGKAACFENGVPETPLLACVAQKIREHYCSAEARREVREALTAEHEADGVAAHESARLRKQIAELAVKIDRGAARVLEAPDDLVPTLYRKLEELRAEQTRLRAELETLTARKTRTRQEAAEEMRQAMRALDELEEHFQRLQGAELRELIQAFVDRVELYFEHGRRGKLTSSRFVRGEIVLRPEPSRMTTASP
jgi:DNA invertase Pin-like site-specific DNA recombinase